MENKQNETDNTNPNCEGDVTAKGLTGMEHLTQEEINTVMGNARNDLRLGRKINAITDTN